jgi:hypothetical protein
MPDQVSTVLQHKPLGRREKGRNLDYPFCLSGDCLQRILYQPGSQIYGLKNVAIYIKK